MTRHRPTTKSIRNTLKVISDPIFFDRKTDEELIGDVSTLITVSLRVAEAFQIEEISDGSICRSLAAFYASVESGERMVMYLERAAEISSRDALEVERLGQTLTYVVGQTSSVKILEAADAFFRTTLLPLLSKGFADEIADELKKAAGRVQQSWCFLLNLMLPRFSPFRPMPE